MKNNFKSVPGVYLAEVKDNTLWIQFDHEKDTNPFSRKLTVAVIELSTQIENDPDIKSVVLTGGLGRSFCAGGDFNDVSKLKEVEETKLYLYEIIDLYQALLRITKPVISLIDNYAIGQGLQVALMTDYRIATDRAQISMPELKNGVACPLGATILETYFGHGQMLEDVVGCSMMTASQALGKKYFNLVCTPEELFQHGKKWAEKLNAYPAVPFQLTKKIYNQKLDQALENVREAAGLAHVETMKAQSAQKHFDKILHGTKEP